MLPGALTLLALLPAPQAPDRPNVLLIISDDQAWTDYGFMGHPFVRTPHLDQLRTESAFFPRGYLSTSLCRASLASIITGLHPHQHGITGNDPPQGVARERMLRAIEQARPLPERLAGLGYRSLQTGKWWEGNCRCGGFTEGMTHGDPERGGRHGDAGLAIGRRTMQPIFDFLDAREEDGAPWLLWYAPFLPHRPHDPPERLLARYRDEVDSRHEARYLAMCEWFDETCGTLLDALETRGMEEDTLVVFLADNGWIQQPDGPGFAARSKRSPYEGGVRTPILLRWPGRIRPRRIDAPVSSVDLAPSVLAACGLEPDPLLPGQDLLAVASGAAEPRGRVFGATYAHDVVDVHDPAASVEARWIVEGRWKLIHHHTDAEPRRELFDLLVDEDERADVSEELPERARRMQERLDAWWPAERVRRPNLLLVVTDDQRSDQFGAAGHPFLQTPHQDDLAARGVRFANAFVTTPICAASRASILTSLHESAHGYTFGTTPIALDHARRSYPALLRASGYRTGFVGKWGVRAAKGAREEMFDHFRSLHRAPYFKEQADGTRRHLTELTADAALAFLQDTGDRPFCLTVSFNAPHAEDGDPRQFIWPESEDALYREVTVPPVPLDGAGWFAAQPEFLRTSLGRIRWKWRFDTEEKRQRMTRGYWRMISGVDRALGRILRALEERGLEEDTVILFTSDNGYFLGERGFAGKWFLYEPSIRVPLVLFDPRTEGGRVDRRPALNLDLAPTLLDLAGIPVPDSYQGRSLLDDEAPPREQVYLEHRFDHDAIPPSEGVRGTRWVYIRYFEEEPTFEELYDLRNDPLQARNLAGLPEHAERLETLRARTDALREAAQADRSE